MSIGGQQRKGNGEFGKRVGLFEAKVLAINPTQEQFSEILGIELPEDSKAADYLRESKEGNTQLRIDVWLQEIKNPDKDPKKVSFFLEDKERMNKDLTKNQYINEVGSCSWAEDPEDLQDWFTAREYRKAYVGEEELYNFLRTWLNQLDYRHKDTTLMQDWKKLMKGNVKELKDQIDGEWVGSFGAMATVAVKDKDGELVEYQGIFNKAFLPAYSLKQFKLVDYSDEAIQNNLKAKKTKDLKPHEKFVLNVAGEYGCKDFYKFKEIDDYDPSENLAASDATMQNAGAGGDVDDDGGAGY